jgi:triosephosphate isomerase
LERSNLQDITIGIAPTYIEIPAAAENIKNILLLSQNVSAQNTGAYTGEVNCQMLKDYNVDGSLIGHSEVREHMNDLDESINKKVQNLLQNNLLPILCIGESLNDFDSGNTINVLKNQIEKDLINIDNNAKIIVAYEPI